MVGGEFGDLVITENRAEPIRLKDAPTHRGRYFTPRASVHIVQVTFFQLFPMKSEHGKGAANTPSVLCFKLKNHNFSERRWLFHLSSLSSSWPAQ